VTNDSLALETEFTQEEEDECLQDDLVVWCVARDVAVAVRLCRGSYTGTQASTGGPTDRSA
jgi:hypothetical protein